MGKLDSSTHITQDCVVKDPLMKQNAMGWYKLSFSSSVATCLFAVAV